MLLLIFQSLLNTFRGSIAVTAAPATSAVAAREVYHATAAVTATAATSAANAREVYHAATALSGTAATSTASDREVYQASSGPTGAAGTCAGSEDEEYQASCAATAQAGTVATSAREVFSATAAGEAAAATTHAAATTTGATTTTETAAGPPGFLEVRSTAGKYPHYAIVTGKVKCKAKRGRSKARGRMLLQGTGVAAFAVPSTDVAAVYQYIFYAAACGCAGPTARTLTATSPPRISGRSESGHRSDVADRIQQLEEELIALLLAA